MTNCWYLIQFKNNFHKVAQQNLKRQAFKTFLPLQNFTSKNGTKFLTRVKPLFPGYMFVSIELDQEPWHKINNTRGVSKIICQNGIPKRIPSEIIIGLMSRCDSFGKLLPPSLKKGETVTLTSGALANFVASVETIESDKRIWILMDIMGHPTKVQVAPEQLRSLK